MDSTELSFENFLEQVAALVQTIAKEQEVTGIERRSEREWWRNQTHVELSREASAPTPMGDVLVLRFTANNPNANRTPEQRTEDGAERAAGAIVGHLSFFGNLNALLGNE